MSSLLLRLQVILLLGLMSLIQACQIFGPGTRGSDEDALDIPVPSQLLSQEAGQEFGAVGRLHADMICTGFWLDLPQEPQSPAMLVTNGHCVQDWSQRSSAWSVVRGITPKLAWSVVFRMFHDAPERQLIVPVKSIVYSTMQGFDLAILELGKSVGELRALGLKPLPLAQTSPSRDDPVRIIGIPEEVAAGQKQFLREHRCREGRRSDVIEWNWYWFDMHSNRCADIANGSSGSPVVDEDQRVFALINTTSRGSQGHACALGQPCEVTPQGVKPQSLTNYAVNLTGLGRCWKKSTWDFEAEDCPLPEPLPFSIEVLSPIAVSAKTEARNWSIDVKSGADEMVRQLTGRADLVRCRDRSAYGAAKSLKKLSPAPIGGDEGVYLNCLWPERSGQRLPILLVTHVDHTPPLGEVKPEVTVFPDSLSLTLAPKPPEWSSFRYALGRKGSLDCRKVALKALPLRPLRLSKKEVPATLCVQGFDQAGNASATLQFNIAADGRLER